MSTVLTSPASDEDGAVAAGAAVVAEGEVAVVQPARASAEAKAMGKRRRIRIFS
jgi:hypothetical protein